MKHRLVFLVLALLVVGLLSTATTFAHQTDFWQPADFEDWMHSFFQPSKDEAEPFANMAYIYQNGDDNQAEQVQQGENNQAYIYQNGDGNMAEQWQYGVGNWAGVYQLGHRNTATTQQVGTDNWAGIYQMGDANTARIQQSGESFTALITQVGNGNTAVIQQKKQVAHNNSRWGFVLIHEEGSRSVRS